MSGIINVASVAELAQIALTPQESEQLQRELEAVVEGLGKIRGADVSGVEPTFYGGGAVNAFREDVVEPSAVTREQMLALAPERHNAEVKLPKIVEEA
ncbi:MAG: Asp-tRNA(Asn)/Glu-tRNA(Gln) amidotransferase subunit GatC [Kiritimatiellaeota bacterium]|nr:Asp-tRNA(Asn)/Glu-tRNA(Gln) amidotransferase subunit GatC [Kiritimatiellota bacterium]